MIWRRSNEEIGQSSGPRDPKNTLVDIPLIMQELDREDPKFRNVRWAWDEDGWKKATAKNFGTDMGLDGESDGEIDLGGDEDDDVDDDDVSLPYGLLPVPRARGRRSPLRAVLLAPGTREAARPLSI